MFQAWVRSSLAPFVPSMLLCVCVFDVDVNRKVTTPDPELALNARLEA